MHYELCIVWCLLVLANLAVKIGHKRSVEDLFVCLSSLRLARDLFHNKQPTPYALPIYLYPLARGGIYASTRSVSAVRDLWIKIWRISKKSQRTKRFRFVLANQKSNGVKSKPSMKFLYEAHSTLLIIHHATCVSDALAWCFRLKSALRAARLLRSHFARIMTHQVCSLERQHEG